MPQAMPTRQVLAALLLYSCGPGLFAQDFAGEPLAEFEVRVALRAEDLKVDLARLSVSLVWGSFDPTAVGCAEDALTIAAAADCLAQPGYFSRVAEAPRITRVSPLGFEVGFFSAPPVAAYRDSVLALADVVVFEDRNQNGALDLLPAYAETPIDEVFGVSVDARVIYAQGPELRVSAWLRDSLGCPAFPQGYSVYWADGAACALGQPRERPLRLALDRSLIARNVICRPPATGTPVLPPPADEPTGLPALCAYDGASLTVNLAPQAYCGHEVTYALKGLLPEPWDVTEHRPMWWPCSKNSPVCQNDTETCASGILTACTCAVNDPCHFAGDGLCQGKTCRAAYGYSFDDAMDCPME